MEFLVGVLDGNLAIPVEVSFATADGTALGKLLVCMSLLYKHHVANGIWIIICANEEILKKQCFLYH